MAPGEYIREARVWTNPQQGSTRAKLGGLYFTTSKSNSGTYEDFKGNFEDASLTLQRERRGSGLLLGVAAMSTLANANG